VARAVGPGKRRLGRAAILPHTPLQATLKPNLVPSQSFGLAGPGQLGGGAAPACAHACSPQRTLCLLPLAVQEHKERAMDAAEAGAELNDGADACRLKVWHAVSARARSRVTQGSTHDEQAQQAQQVQQGQQGQGQLQHSLQPLLQQSSPGVQQQGQQQGQQQLGKGSRRVQQQQPASAQYGSRQHLMHSLPQLPSQVSGVWCAAGWGKW